MDFPRYKSYLSVPRILFPYRRGEKEVDVRLTSPESPGSLGFPPVSVSYLRRPGDLVVHLPTYGPFIVGLFVLDTPLLAGSWSILCQYTGASMDPHVYSSNLSI